jgi:hypothetical protein
MKVWGSFTKFKSIYMITLAHYLPLHGAKLMLGKIGVLLAQIKAMVWSSVAVCVPFTTMH